MHPIKMSLCQINLESTRYRRMTKKSIDLFSFGWGQWDAQGRWEGYKEQPKKYTFGGYHTQLEIVFV